MRGVHLLLVLFALMACAPEPTVEIEPHGNALEVWADAPIQGVEIRNPAGDVLARQDLPRPSSAVWLPLPWTEGENYRLKLRLAHGTVRVPWTAPHRTAPVEVVVEAPLGHPWPEFPKEGERLTLPALDGQVPIALVATALEPTVLTVGVGDRKERVELGVAGERAVIDHALRRPQRVELQAPGWERSFRVVPVSQSLEDLQDQLAWTGATFPADDRGRPDPARPQDRVTLPAPWWSWVSGWGLGTRPSDPTVPWAWQSIELQNRGDQPLHVALELRFLDQTGAPSAAFRPRLREADGDLEAVVAMLRVPARDRATAALPVYLDPSLLEPGVVDRRIEVRLLGDEDPVWAREVPLQISRGSPWAGAALIGGMLGALLGAVFVGFGVRGWLNRRATSELTTIALFASLQLVVGLAAQVLASGAALVLGPFAPLLTGLVDEVLRACLLGTLLVLLPRPGVAALSLLVGWLLRVLALGAFNPVDLALLLGTVAWVEAVLWVGGITRGQAGAWRLAGTLALASLLPAAVALGVHVVLYRLFLADWYVAMILLGPSFLYPFVGGLLAFGFARSLRQVGA